MRVFLLGYDPRGGSYWMEFEAVRRLDRGPELPLRSRLRDPQRRQLAEVLWARGRSRQRRIRRPRELLRRLSDGYYAGIACFPGMSRDSTVDAWDLVMKQLKELWKRTRPIALDRDEFELCLVYWRLRHPISAAEPETLPPPEAIRGYRSGEGMVTGWRWEGLFRIPSREELRAYLVGRHAAEGRVGWAREAAGHPELFWFLRERLRPPDRKNEKAVREAVGKLRAEMDNLRAETVQPPAESGAARCRHPFLAIARTEDGWICLRCKKTHPHLRLFHLKTSAAPLPGLPVAEAFLSGLGGGAKRALEKVAEMAGVSADSASYIRGRITRFRELLAARDPELAELAAQIEREMPDARTRPRRRRY